jgi:hypothetical protein
MGKHCFEVLGPLPFNEHTRSRFRSGRLARSWATEFPQLFDASDLQRALNQSHNHFAEWAAAIHLYQTLGHLSIQKYEFPVASKARAPMVTDILGASTAQWLWSRQGRRRVQCPDLLVYTADSSEVYFCEVKGPGDRLRERQIEFFQELVARTGLGVKLLTFAPTAAAGGGESVGWSG